MPARSSPAAPGFIGSHVADALLARGDRGRGGRRPLDRASASACPRGGRVPPDRHPLRAPSCARSRPSSGPTRSSTWPPRPTCASRSTTPAATPTSTCAARPRCSRRRGAAGAPGRLLVHRRRHLRRGRHDPLARVDALRGDGALRRLQAVRRALPRALQPPLRHAPRRPALRQRVRAAPGPARRGRRGRDLLRQAASRARRRSSSATAARRATTSTSATSSRPTWPRSTTAARTRSFNIGTAAETSVLDLLAECQRAAGHRRRAGAPAGAAGRARPQRA